MAVGDLDQALDVLVYDQDGLALALQRAKALPDFFAYQRRKPFGSFIEDQQVRVGHQRATNGEHLLLAAGELVAHVAAALGEAREKAEYLGQRPGFFGAAAVAGKGDEVLAHGEIGEYLPALGHQCHTHARDAV